MITKRKELPIINMRLFLVMLFVCLATVCCLASCTNNPGDTDSTVGETTTQPTKTNIDSLVLAENGTPTVTVIRSEDAGEIAKSAAMSVRNALQKLCPNATVKIATDLNIGEYDASAPEILVGMTERSESVEVMDSISYGEYSIALKGNKLVIAAWSDDALDYAVQKFNALLESRQNEGAKIQIGIEDCFTKTYNKWLAKIPAIPGKKISSIYDCGDSAYQVLLNNVTDETYTSYLSLLQAEKNGFVLDGEREVMQNKFATLNGDGCSVSVSYIPSTSSMQIIAEPIKNRYMPENAPFDKVTTPKLTMIGRKFGNGTDDPIKIDASSGLMSFVLRLANGHFIVIDGGVATDAFAQAIYATMLSDAPDSKNLTIDAWIITHTHTDHTGGFCKFSELYSSVVKIERFFYNFPSEKDVKHFNETAQVNRLASHIQTYYPKTPVYKVHTGQKYTFADADVEFFFAPEDYITKKRSWQDANNANLTSLVFNITVGGQKLLFMGDCAEQSDNIIAQRFGSYLKCDVLQVSHHGGPGSGTACYRKADPAVALFSTSDTLLPVYLERYQSNIVLMKELNVKLTYNAADRITSWDLPMAVTPN